MLHKYLLAALLLSSIVVNTNAGTIELIHDHKSDWSIVSLSTSEEIQFAATELRHYLQQIGGCTLPVKSKAGNAPTIFIGLRKEIPAKFAALLPPTHPGYDGYAFVVSEKPAVIIIAGDNPQGAIYGVYNMLEKLGCRWFYPTQDANDPEVVPSLQVVAFNPLKESMASPIKNRICNGDAWFFDVEYAKAKKQLDWAMKNRYNAIGWQAGASNQKRSILDQYLGLDSAGITKELRKRGMFLHGPAHSFDQFLLSDKYFADHPEWFGMRNGKRSPQNFFGAQFCWSNAEARKQFISNATDFIVLAPEIHIFCTIPFDGGVPCECDVCKKAGSSNLLMLLCSELIEAVKKVRPEVQVETIGGYGAVQDPPTDLSIINPSQRIVWAQWGRYHGVGYNDASYDRRNLDNWAKAAKGGLTICNYYADNFAEPWVMGLFAKAIISDREYFLANKVDALYVLYWSPGYWWNHSLNGYLAGRCYYDTSLNPFDEVKDYALHYFGTEAGPMLANYYAEWAQNIDLSYKVRGGSTPEERATLKKERTQWLEPAYQATKSSATYAYRLRKTILLHNLAENLYEAQRLNDLAELYRITSRFEDAATIVEKGKIQTAKAINMFYDLAAMNIGLIDKGDVEGFSAPAVKRWIEEETKRIAAKDTTTYKSLEALQKTEILPGDLVP